MKKMITLVHEAKAFAFHHSDGAIRKIIPDLIDIGIDILNPIQWRCRGMEREGLKKDFGSKLVFHSGVDNQQTLPFGSVAAVKQEVKENIEILGKNGGYFCNADQGMPWPKEHYAALRDAVEEFGKYPLGN